jgi:hypothetical protein
MASIIEGMRHSFAWTCWFLCATSALASSCGAGLHTSPPETRSSEGNGGGGTNGPTYKKMFVTTNTTDGNMGGVAGADALCASDPGKPTGGGTYKALIVDGAARVACTTANCSGGPGEHTDWVLQPNETYARSDGTTIIGATNANGLFVFPLTNSVVTVMRNMLTGTASNWTTHAGSNCTAWTATGGNARYGVSTSTIATFIFAPISTSCANQSYLLCIEQ